MHLEPMGSTSNSDNDNSTMVRQGPTFDGDNGDGTITKQGLETCLEPWVLLSMVTTTKGLKTHLKFQVRSLF